MSLLDHGPHTVVVYPEVETTDSRGNIVRKPAEEGVEIRGRMQSVTSARDPGSDRRLGDVEAYRFSARAAPLGRWARVEWRGKVFHVESGPHRRDETPAVTRVVCTLVRDS